MKKRIAIITALALAVCVSISSAATVRYPDENDASSGNILLGAEGTYENVSSDKVLTRINQIRKEAYNEGIVSSYVPVKWSKGLEYISQIRSAEASVLESHVRPNGGDLFDMSSDGTSSYAENLAWGGNALNAIEMWYSEKQDLVNNTGGETGHYTSMINPNLTYVGIGSFQEKGNWNCVCAEFSYNSGNTEARTGLSGACIQLIEIPRSKVKASVTGASEVVTGEST